MCTFKKSRDLLENYFLPAGNLVPECMEITLLTNLDESSLHTIVFSWMKELNNLQSYFTPHFQCPCYSVLVSDSVAWPFRISVSLNFLLLCLMCPMNISLMALAPNPHSEKMYLADSFPSVKCFTNSLSFTFSLTRWALNDGISPSVGHCCLISTRTVLFCQKETEQNSHISHPFSLVNSLDHFFE